MADGEARLTPPGAHDLRSEEEDAQGNCGIDRKLLAEMVWPHFLAVQILLIVMIFSYCTIRELARVLGRDKLIEIFFGIRLRARVSPNERPY
jgi:hypothetical protein